MFFPECDICCGSNWLVLGFLMLDKINDIFFYFITRMFIYTVNSKLRVFQVNFWTQNEIQEQEKPF